MITLESFANTPRISDAEINELEAAAISTAIGRAQMEINPHTVLALIARIKGICNGKPHPPRRI